MCDCLLAFLLARLFFQSVCSRSCLFVWLSSHDGNEILDGGTGSNFCVFCPGVSVGRCFPTEALCIYAIMKFLSGGAFTTTCLACFALECLSRECA